MLSHFERKLLAIDVMGIGEDWNIFTKSLLQCFQKSAVGFWIPEWSARQVGNGKTLSGNYDFDRAFRQVQSLRENLT